MALRVCEVCGMPLHPETDSGMCERCQRLADQAGVQRREDLRGLIEAETADAPYGGTAA